jgi:hypothetical protein
MDQMGRPCAARIFCARDHDIASLTPYGNGTLPLGNRSRTVANVNGLTVHILEAGYEVPGRPAVLLLHGFPELAYSWRKVQRGPKPVKVRRSLEKIRSLNSRKNSESSEESSSRSYDPLLDPRSSSDAPADVLRALRQGLKETVALAAKAATGRSPSSSSPPKTRSSLVLSPVSLGRAAT